MIVTTRYIHTAPFCLDAMSLELPVLADAHPNRVPFRGILTRVDEPSTRPPHGSQDHRVLIPRRVAEAAGDTVVGMPVDCSWNLKGHNKRQNVGVITGWAIEGKDFLVEGHLFGKNFPAEIADIQSHKAQLGMSYEVGDVDVVDTTAPVWELSHFVFTGAAILRKDAAAYATTAIAAQAEEEAMEKNVLDELHALGAKIDGLHAAMDADADDEAARRDEEEAATQDAAAQTALTAARRAREDADEEDARRHEAAAAACHTKAFQARMKASQWHASMAARRREEGDEEAATRHEADANRLKAAAEVAQKAAADLQDASEATEDADAETDTAAASEEDMASMGRLFAAFLRAAGLPPAQKKLARDPKKRQATPLDEVMGRMVAAMAAEHDDEDEDKVLMRRLLRQDKQRDVKASSIVEVRRDRKLRDLQASVELLTDAVGKLTGLLTDRSQPRTGLLTDSGASTPNGGAAPIRRSMQATGREPDWVDKYEGRRDARQGKKTQADVTKDLIAEGITDARAQMARILELQAAGQLAD